MPDSLHSGEHRPPGRFDITYIMTVLPHRFPILLLDRIVALCPGISAEGYKLVSCNEPWFRPNGSHHFPQLSIIEAMAQLAGCIALEPHEFVHRPPYFVGIDRARFRKAVYPGDHLAMRATIAMQRRSVTKVETEARVSGILVCSATLSFAAPTLPR